MSKFKEGISKANELEWLVLGVFGHVCVSECVRERERVTDKEC